MISLKLKNRDGVSVDLVLFIQVASTLILNVTRSIREKSAMVTSAMIENIMKNFINSAQLSRSKNYISET